LIRISGKGGGAAFLKRRFFDETCFTTRPNRFYADILRLIGWILNI
jgi:hypothetical protein